MKEQPFGESKGLGVEREDPLHNGNPNPRTYRESTDRVSFVSCGRLKRRWEWWGKWGEV